MFFLLTLTIITTELYLYLFKAYPPSLEQLHLGLIGYTSLWSVRIAALLLLIISVYFFTISLHSKVREYSWVIILASPAIFAASIFGVIEVVIVSTVAFVTYITLKKFNKPFITTILGSLIIVIFNLVLFQQKPDILRVVNLQRPQDEVNFRFIVEDGILSPIYIPRIIKRSVYNKYFFAFKDFFQESLAFFDLETVFFQDVHPLGQKSFSFFFWPEIILFFIGIFAIKKEGRTLKNIITILFVYSYIYFMTSNSIIINRMFFALFPTGIIISYGITQIRLDKNVLSKTLFILLSALCIYSWITNYSDRFTRQDFWINNRILTYKNIFSFFQINKLNNKNIIISKNLYSFKDYCYFYSLDCSKFIISDFNLLDNPPVENSIYVGFGGNYMGRIGKDKNYNEIKQYLANTGFTILDHFHIRDNIADGYGQELIIASFEKKTK